MILRIIYSGIFIKHHFQVHCYLFWSCKFHRCFYPCKYWFFLSPQDSSTFSFYRCLPSGWKVLLFSGITTTISERIFLDRENFWPTFLVHFSIGVACFCMSSFVMYVLVPCVHTEIFVSWCPSYFAHEDINHVFCFYIPQQIPPWEIVHQQNHPLPWSHRLNNRLFFDPPTDSVVFSS